MGWRHSSSYTAKKSSLFSPSSSSPPQKNSWRQGRLSKNEEKKHQQPTNTSVVSRTLVWGDEQMTRRTVAEWYRPESRPVDFGPAKWKPNSPRRSSGRSRPRLRRNRWLHRTAVPLFHITSQSPPDGAVSIIDSIPPPRRSNRRRDVDDSSWTSSPSCQETMFAFKRIFSMSLYYSL